MIKIDIPVPNGFLYFVRQYPKSVNGVYQRELPGSTVSGMPVGGIIASDVPIGTKIALTDPAKLSPGEVGYIVVQSQSDGIFIVTDKHNYKCNYSAFERGDGTNAALNDMTEKARNVVSVVAHGLNRSQALGGIPYFSSQANRIFVDNWWLLGQPTSYTCYRVDSAGSIEEIIQSGSSCARPLLSIPANTLLSANPNSSGAYELV